MLSKNYIRTIVGLLCHTRPTLWFDIRFVLVHLVLYGMVGIVALLCHTRATHFNHYYMEMKGLTKLRHYGLLCTHKAISVLEASLIVESCMDCNWKGSPTFELISVCCVHTRHL